MGKDQQTRRAGASGRRKGATLICKWWSALSGGSSLGRALTEARSRVCRGESEQRNDEEEKGAGFGDGARTAQQAGSSAGAGGVCVAVVGAPDLIIGLGDMAVGIAVGARSGSHELAQRFSP